MIEQEKQVYFEKFNNQIHFLGRLFLSIGIVVLVVCPFAMGLVLNVKPDMAAVVKGFLMVLPIYLPSSVAEYIIYSPMLGAGATYLALITGNMTNIKIPCVLNARDLLDTKIGTAENEIVSTLSVATSSLVTIVAIMMGIVLLIPLQPILANPAFVPAFNNVIPSLYGAMAFKYFIKSKRITIIPIILMGTLYMAVPALIKITTSLMIPVAMVTIAGAYLLFKKDKLESNLG